MIFKKIPRPTIQEFFFYFKLCYILIRLINQRYDFFFLAAASFMPNKPGTLLVELGPEDKEYQAVDEEVGFTDLL